MSNDLFDFTAASTLIQAVEGAASAIDIKNGQMEQRFGKLREGFKDAGYDALAIDMKAANVAISEVIKQLHSVSKHIADYAVKLQNEA